MRHHASLARGLLATCIASALALIAPGASAYCRTSTCTDCPRGPDNCTVGGLSIAWPRTCMSYSVEVSASKWADYDTIVQIADQAFGAWQEVDCGGGAHPSFHAMNPYGPVECARLEYNTTQANANVIMFRDDAWPHDGAGQALALTTVTFDKTTGAIYDADMEINGTIQLSTDGAPGNFEAHDLLSIITHEAGHFYGLDHTLVGDAVMQISLGAGELRTVLSQDDTDAICAVYPPDHDRGACDYEPNHGFSPECMLDPATGGGCRVAQVATTNPSVAPRSASDAAPLAGGGAMIGLGLLARRRRRGGM